MMYANSNINTELPLLQNPTMTVASTNCNASTSAINSSSIGNNTTMGNFNANHCPTNQFYNFPYSYNY